MPRFNLLKKIKSIRNTVEPDTPVPGQSGSKFPKVLLGLALIVTGAVALATSGIVSVSYSPGRTPPVIIDFTGWKNHEGVAMYQDRRDTAIGKDRSTPVADSEEPAPDETAQEKNFNTSKAAVSKQKPDDTGVSQRKPPDVVKRDRSVLVAGSEEPAPDETGRGDDSNEAVTALISRPIAQKAAIARKKPESNKVWYIRFAICVIKKSCERIITRLKEKGVNAYMEKGVANITTHRAIAGPWPTRAHARETRVKLKRDGYDSSIFASGGRYFLSTEPLASQAMAQKECRKIKAPGSECRPSSKKETRKVYKIYEGAYKSKRDAINRRMAYSKRGIDCIVESN